MIFLHLKTSIALGFFIGSMAFTTAQSNQTTPPVFQPPDPMLMIENERLSYDIQHGREVYVNGISPQETSSTGSTSQTVGNFLRITNFDKTSWNKTETGKLLVSKYAAEADKGNEEKMMYMALTYRIFLNDEKNEIVWLDKLVAKNNMYALMRRGDLFEDAKNIDNSVILYRKAVASGNDVAMVGLAEKYMLHVKNEIYKPVELLTAAAAMNNAEACMVLGNLYNGIYGKQYPQDYTKAMNFYLKYLQLSDKPLDSDIIAERSKVMESIALMYKNGNGVAIDNTVNRQWIKRSKKEEKKLKQIH